MPCDTLTMLPSFLQTPFRRGRAEWLQSKRRHLGVLVPLPMREGPAELQELDALLVKGEILQGEVGWMFGIVTGFLCLSQGSRFAVLL